MFTIRLEKDISYQTIRDTVYILKDQNGYVYQLDGVGKDYWELITTDGSFSEAIETLLRLYRVSHEVLVDDLIELTDELSASQLIEVCYD